MAEINNNPYQYQYPQQFGSHNVASRGIEDYKTKNRLVGSVVDSVDSSNGNPSSETPSFMNFLAGTAICSGIVRFTNWLLKPSKKYVTETMTQNDAYVNSRLYRAGERIAQTAPAQKLSRATNTVKGWLSKIPVPDFIKDFGRKYKTGSSSVWGAQTMYTVGKGPEAVSEFLGYLSQANKQDLAKLLGEANNTIVNNTLKLFENGKIDATTAFSRVENIIGKTSAEGLSKVGFVPQGNIFKKALFYINKGFSKVLGTPKNLSLAFTKAQTFQKAGLFGKTVSLAGEATGGGVLGGSIALIMSAYCLAQNIDKARNAEDGEKLKTFMDEFAGVTLGGYLLPMFMSIQMNKVLGNAELGANVNAKGMKQIIDALQLENPKRVLDVIKEYNKFIPKNQALHADLLKLAPGELTGTKILELFEKHGISYTRKDKFLLGVLSRLSEGKMTVDEARKRLMRQGFKVPSSETIKAIMKDSPEKLTKLGVKMRVSHLNNMRNTMEKALDSDLTIKSIFKRKPGSGVFSTLGQWGKNACKYIVQKPVAKVSRFFTTGRYTMSKVNGNFIGNFFRRCKRWGGGIGRIFLVISFLGPLVADPCQALVHKIFGKPKAKILEEEREKREAEEARRQEEMANNPNAAQGPQEYVPFSNQNKNLVEMYTGKKPSEIKNNGDTATYVPNQHLASNTQTGYDTVNYVPNQMLTQESFVDPNVTQDLLSRRDLAVRRAEAAEKNYKELLGRL